MARLKIDILRTIAVGFAAAAFAAICGGCAKPELSNQAAEFWYRDMAKQIAANNLDAAGDRYSSLASEHLASPLLAEAALMMADAHMNNEEYLLANFYLDEYIKRFGDRQNIDRIRYLKLLADYRGIKRATRDQKLVIDAIDKSAEFDLEFSDSQARFYADSIAFKMRLSQVDLAEKAADLYERLDKPKAAEFYRKAADFAPLKDGEYEPATTWWPRSMFDN